jgi:hypothetical protein
MVKAGDVISYLQMCAEENTSFRRGMNFGRKGKPSVILMSTRAGAPYKDRVEANGRVLIYEGHDNPVPGSGRRPKEVDQESRTPEGGLTQNGLFYEAAQKYKNGHSPAEIVKVYEKIRTGIWVYNGIFELLDASTVATEGRRVFKFRLELVGNTEAIESGRRELEDTRLIPSHVKLEVWKRDGGKCVKCGSKTSLHFDHIIPYSRGGTSLDAKNIQLLCARHNLQKHDRIE